MVTKKDASETGTFCGDTCTSRIPTKKREAALVASALICASLSLLTSCTMAATKWSATRSFKWHCKAGAGLQLQMTRRMASSTPTLRFLLRNVVFKCSTRTCFHRKKLHILTSVLDAFWLWMTGRESSQCASKQMKWPRHKLWGASRREKLMFTDFCFHVNSQTQILKSSALNLASVCCILARRSYFFAARSLHLPSALNIDCMYPEALSHRRVLDTMTSLLWRSTSTRSVTWTHMNTILKTFMPWELIRAVCKAEMTLSISMGVILDLFICFHFVKRKNANIAVFACFSFRCARSMATLMASNRWPLSRTTKPFQPMAEEDPKKNADETGAAI